MPEIFTPRKFPEYIYKPEYLNKFRQRHREHQNKAIDAAANNIMGQIILPCGTGKTRIQTDLHINTMIEAQKVGEYSTTLIASHRLSLNKQLASDVAIEAILCGLRFNILFVGSGHHNFSDSIFKKENEKLGFGRHICKIHGTLSPDEIKVFSENTITR